MYRSRGEVEVVDIGYPKFEFPKELGSGPIHHGVIIELVATNICGSDQHMVRGRTDAAPGRRWATSRRAWWWRSAATWRHSKWATW